MYRDLWNCEVGATYSYEDSLRFEMRLEKKCCRAKPARPYPSRERDYGGERSSLHHSTRSEGFRV